MQSTEAAFETRITHSAACNYFCRPLIYQITIVLQLFSNIMVIAQQEKPEQVIQSGTVWTCFKQPDVISLTLLMSRVSFNFSDV